MAVEAARALEFVKTAKYTLSLAELRTVVTDGHCPIVFVDLHPIDGLDAIHAMVVVEVSEQAVVVLDPLQGERRFPVDIFTAAWARRHNLALLVVP
jgi:hypothetical protein